MGVIVTMNQTAYIHNTRHILEFVHQTSLTFINDISFTIQYINSIVAIHILTFIVNIILSVL